jgi:hypothetical protein
VTGTRTALPISHSAEENVLDRENEIEGCEICVMRTVSQRNKEIRGA